MRIAVPTNYAIPDIKGPYFSDIEWITKTFRRLRESGFRVLDWSSCDFARVFTSPGDTYLVRDGWEEFGHLLLEAAESQGMMFNQSHGLIFNPFDGSEQSEFLSGIEQRVVKVCSILGIKYIVKHPSIPPYADDWNGKEAYDANADYFRKQADLAGQYGINMVLENSFDLQGRKKINNSPESLLELANRINRSNIRICLDVGHAHLMGEDLAESCRKYGSLLACLHIHDNDGTRDQHRMPLHGTINWGSLFDGLKSIDYKGDFTLEVHPVLKASDRLRKHQEREAYMVCEDLILLHGFTTE